MAIKVTWESGMKFVGENERGNRVTMETGLKYGGSGQYPTPMEIVAMALGGCTGLDVVSILKKMRVDLKRLEIEVETKRHAEPPEYFEEINLVFTISGEGLTQENANRAVSLSSEKYCSVGAMLREKAKITHSIKVV
ncbi:MAG TPA: OsmC family protein [bacterium]|nr:OsmC family protein [bacterium]